MPIAVKYELKKLTLPDGLCLFDEWFDTLAIEDQAMIDSRLARVRLGSFGEINDVSSGVWELKFHKGRAIRIYFGRIGRAILLLIIGGDKRTQKKDIVRARNLFAAYKRGELQNASH